MRTALITGINGQDGSYLAELLLTKDYHVIGLVHGSKEHPQRLIQHLSPLIDLTEGDLLDQACLTDLLRQYRPTEVYNLAAYHPFSSETQDDPVLIGELNGLAPLRWLEAIKRTDRSIRFCQASSAQIFGNTPESPQNENSPCYPTNPYAMAKLLAHQGVAYYRKKHGLFACSSILFNHESPRRSEKFVTRKISLGVARIKAGLQDKLYLNDLCAARDWGYAPDYVQGMWLTLQAPHPDDYILATGELHSVREFCEVAFRAVGMDYTQYLDQNASGVPVTQSHPSVGNANKARKLLNWHRTLSFQQLVTKMVQEDVTSVCHGDWLRESPRVHP